MKKSWPNDCFLLHFVWPTCVYKVSDMFGLFVSRGISVLTFGFSQQIYFFLAVGTISTNSTSKIRAEKGLISPPVSREP